MNILYSWLRDYVDCPLSAKEVAEALTSIGLEVGSIEEVQAIKGGLAGLVVGQVLSCVPHPNSDHMHVCGVDVGDGAEPLQIVCGAPNVAAGQKVVVATMGTKLYAGEECFTIKKSKLRGVESCGMICAEDEIGVGTSHEGIIVLPDDTPVGLAAADYYHVESDWLIEVDITPNRADACSHYGVARDLYAYLRRHNLPTALHRPSVENFEVDDNSRPFAIEVECGEACPRYAAVAITDCAVKESPEWLKKRLTAIGQRPINNIVDITNYIMMAYGQPLHCFDADMVEGDRVVVKTLPEGTHFVTLDGVEHKLSASDLAICNAREPMCIAGVFGGKGSGTYDTTRNILLESAYFHPTWIRKSARRHGLSTESSFRFERGVDPDGQTYALKAAALMVKELAGGKVAMPIADVEQRGLKKSFPVTLNYAYLDALVGKHIPRETVGGILSSLEMNSTGETPDGAAVHLEVPAYRVDVTRPCDVVEEILRIYGYNNVETPARISSCLAIKGKDDRSYTLEKLVSEQLVGCGFREILNNSLTKAAWYDSLNAFPATDLVRLLNPLSADLNAMRQTLLFGGLEVISRNGKHRAHNLKLFEVGNVYARHEERRTANVDNTSPHASLAAYAETAALALWLTGKRVERAWAHSDEDASFFELKAYVKNIFTRLGISSGAYAAEEKPLPDIFAQALILSTRGGGKTFGALGVVAKTLTDKADIEAPVYFAELDWTQLMKMSWNRRVEGATELPKYPAVSRDLALLVDKDIPFAKIEQIAYAAERKLLRRVTLFDVYEGKNIEPGKKSYAVNFVLQDYGGTMNDRQTDAIMNKIIAQLERQLGAKLR